jgi:hypothetical protein
MKLKTPTVEDEYMAFEICGELFKISEYDNAINGKYDVLSAYYEELHEFPYTVRKRSWDKCLKIQQKQFFLLHGGVAAISLWCLPTAQPPY